MDMIFKALADPARRARLDSLRDRDGQTLSELEAGFDMTRFGVMKHLGVLEEAGLVVSVKKGRFKYHYLNAVPLQEVIDRWIDPFRAKPAARAVLNLKSTLEGHATMADKPDYVLQTFIRCTQDALWEALTDPVQMSRFHFMAHEVRKEDDRYIYAHPDGSAMLECRTLEVDPKSRIVSTFEPKWDPAMPASRAVYRLSPEGDYMKLVVEHYDLAMPVVPGEGVADGWSRWAAGLKTFLETGTAQKYYAASAANG